MRITSQMLSASAQKAGVQINHTLLDYVKSDKKGNTLQQVLSANKTNTKNTTQKKNYEKLDEAADSLTEQVMTLMSEKEDSVFGKLATDDTEKNRNVLYDTVEKLVNSYNDTRKTLLTAQGTLNNYYAKLLKKAAEDDAESLASIGITVDGGNMSLDTEKLKSAELDVIKKVLGGNSIFMEKTAVLAEHASDNAEAGLDNLSSQYSANGVNYSARNSKYDSRG